MYSIKKVAEMTGIQPVTLRAWERRYRFPVPSRDENGFRSYSRQDIDDILWVKQQREAKGQSVSKAIELLKRLDTHPSSVPVDHEKESQLDEQIYHAFLRFDAVKANQQIDLAFSMFDFEDVFHSILKPVLHRIGEGWQTGSVSVAQEHFATQIVHQRIQTILQTLVPDPTKPKALALCPPEELHHIGLLLFALFLQRRGCQVLLLGPNTPLNGVPEIIDSQRIEIVAISVTNRFHLDKVTALVQKIHDQRDSIHIAVGGQAVINVEPSLAQFLLQDHLESWKNWFRRHVL